jgi:TolB-like protein/tetratricopeptide (TPR) repeat protein/class 3 adenylate cyclase
MPTDSESDLQLEIGHVLLIDIVGYSQLLITEQRKRLRVLNEIVRNTAQFRASDANGMLVRIPTGDGMALIFRDTVEAPIRCAVEISQAVKTHPELHLRMGIHSGPVSEVTDVNERTNIAGAGIDIAQRVMDYGDAGHILLSKHVADDLTPFPRWNRHLHDLGECEVKHGGKVSLVNFYTEDLGNPQLPEKLRRARQEQARRAIAVLPFDNQNRDSDTDYLSDGIPESIIHSLSQLPQLRVMARSTVFSYKGKDVDPRKVGNDLGVDAVLMGRLIQQGDNLAIRTELVDVADGTEIWGQQYNRRLADVFAVQEDIAKEISEKLRLKLSGAERQQLAKRPTRNIKAFQYYMQGRSVGQRRTREDMLTAIRYYERAIEEDRNYALAYAGLADATSTLGVLGYIPPIEGRSKTDENARQALALDENLAEAHAALGLPHTFFAPYNFSLGDRELRRAIELSPSLAIVHFYLATSLARQGRFDESIEEYVIARELDPLSSIIARSLALPYYLKRDYVRALEFVRQADEIGPAWSTTFEIGVYIQNRKFDEALAELEKAKRERKGDPILIYSTGMVYAAQGKRAEALQIIKELEDMSGASLSEAHWIAKVYAALNEKEQALTWLDRGLATGAIGSFYKDEPVWDPIRSHPRFEALVGKMFVPIKTPGDAR